MGQDDNEAVILIGLVLILVIAHRKGLLQPIIEKLKTLIPTLGGGGGPISSTGGCAGTALTKDTGNNREEFESHNIPGDPSSYEVTWCGKIGSQGEDLTFKMYGPRHQNSGDCCWCVMHVDASGKMTPGGEGPHPGSNCEHGGGGSAGVAPCYKAVMRPGPVQEGYALIGGTWKKVAEYKGPCGCSKKSSTKTGNTVMVRCDGPITTKCASVKALGSAAPTKASLSREVIQLIPNIALS